jgi:hypothetical protein
MYLGYGRRERQRSKDLYLRGECRVTSADSRYSNEVLKSAFVGSTWYAALRINRPGVPSKTVGVVFLTSTRGTKEKGDSFGNFCYKDMTEFSGPCEAKCPIAILDMLSPLDETDTFALEWRQRVRDYHDYRNRLQRTKAAALGSHVRLEHPIRYDNGDLVSTGVLVTFNGRRGRKRLGLSNDGLVYRLPLRILASATVILPPALAL